ncbi:thiamine phosphate synthase [Xanthobacter sp. V4C-4]|uniref:thiamine phosphate synthase n=1 Tax=Xanthobacter cornucopiae TaxID=3119924 RepID=UPI0037284FB3
MSQSAAPLRARLMLILSPALAPQDAVARVAAGDVAAVILRPGATSPDVARLRALAQPLQKRDCAVLVEAHVEAVEPARLDGAHMGDTVHDPAPLAAALGRLKPDNIVGAGGFSSRHDAMEAGESGADYILFGPLSGSGAEFARTCALVDWWTELFEVPAAAVAGSPAEVAALAQAGADFIALAQDWIEGADGVSAVGAAQAEIDAHCAHLGHGATDADPTP